MAKRNKDFSAIKKIMIKNQSQNAQQKNPDL